MLRGLDCCHAFMLALLSLFCSPVAEDKLQAGSALQITAVLGGDVILPCKAELWNDSVKSFAVEWTRRNLTPKYVHVHRNGKEDSTEKNPAYQNRTSLFKDQLQDRNCSLRISTVRLSDEGIYRCFLPRSGPQFLINLTVVAVSNPEISLVKRDQNSGVVLQCESNGWYPEPEVSWLDSEGNLLNVESTEMVRQPDGLYTVRNHMTVEKINTNRFTCRIQHQNIRHSRETMIDTAEFFNPCPSQISRSEIVAWVLVGVLVCILLVVLARDPADSPRTLYHSTPKREPNETQVNTGAPEEKTFEDSGFISRSNDSAANMSITNSPLLQPDFSGCSCVGGLYGCGNCTLRETDTDIAHSE